MKESHLDEGVITSSNNDIWAVFGIAYSVHIISMRPHPHSGLQAPQCVCLLQMQLRLARDGSRTQVQQQSQKHNLV